METKNENENLIENPKTSDKIAVIAIAVMVVLIIAIILVLSLRKHKTAGQIELPEALPLIDGAN